MTTALVSIISRVITSQQFFLYNSITFISISIASIPVPAIHIPTINISNNQYTIPAIKAFGIFVLICAAECPASIVHPTKVCMNDARNLEFSLLFIRTMINLIMQRQMFITYLCPFTPPQFTIFWIVPSSSIGQHPFPLQAVSCSNLLNSVFV